MGLGDLIEKITTYTGIKWVVKRYGEISVGFDDRKKKANKVNYGRKRFTKWYKFLGRSS
ncbi:MAG: hypothetical protein CM15mV109_100 [uncultured marine virus]|nr:MAG: hypothetical protein CM15mV109_100 [uncultured marine virus]